MGPSAPLALPPSVFHGFILLAPCSRVLENLARLPRYVASAGFARRCWRNTNHQKKEGSKSPLLIKPWPYKWRTIFFVEWYDCTAFVRAPLTQLTTIAGVCAEPADVGRLQGLPRVKSFYHFVTTVNMYLKVDALEFLSWLTMVPVSIADATSATTPLTEVSSFPCSSMGISHFLPLSLDTTTLVDSRSIVTITDLCIFLCRLAHRRGVLMAGACAPAEVHYFCRIANMQSIHCLFSKGHGLGVWFRTQHPVNLRI